MFKVTDYAALMKVESIAESAHTFDLHKGIIGIENYFLEFLRMAVLHRLYCSFRWKTRHVMMWPPGGGGGGGGGYSHFFFMRRLRASIYC